MEEDLHSFWFSHVIPAREMVEAGNMTKQSIIAQLGAATLGESSEHAKELKARGRELVKKAEEIRFEPRSFSDTFPEQSSSLL